MTIDGKAKHLSQHIYIFCEICLLVIQHNTILTSSTWIELKIYTNVKYECFNLDSSSLFFPGVISKFEYTGVGAFRNYQQIYNFDKIARVTSVDESKRQVLFFHI